jgi:hypothetical protein
MWRKNEPRPDPKTYRCRAEGRAWTGSGGCGELRRGAFAEDEDPAGPSVPFILGVPPFRPIGVPRAPPNGGPVLGRDSVPAGASASARPEFEQVRAGSAILRN